MSRTFFPEPELPWATDALSKKGISQETIEYHYGKHHLGYVRKLNALALKDKTLQNLSIVDIILNRDGKSFNLAAQIWNHSFYFNGMSGIGGDISVIKNSKLYNSIILSFNSFNEFKKEFSLRAGSHFGSGWIFLCLDKYNNNTLIIKDGHDAYNPLREGLTPILCIDVWEHAYYIDQRNNRGNYIKIWFDCIDWNIISKRFNNLILKQSKL